MASLTNPDADPASTMVGRPLDASLARLLGLLQAGEQSADAAFGRMIRRLAPATAARVAHALMFIQKDERRHAQLLRQATDPGSEQCPLDSTARRFFAGLESRNLNVHLARIAALDGCVCQVLARVVSGDARTRLPPALLASLTSIREDEGRHVRIARNLALDLGCDPAQLQNLGLETRHAFDHVLAGYDAALVELGVDTVALRRQLRRDPH